MGCDTCKSECGREDGCGTRKATQKVVLDGLAGAALSQPNLGPGGTMRRAFARGCR